MSSSQRNRDSRPPTESGSQELDDSQRSHEPGSQSTSDSQKPDARTGLDIQASAIQATCPQCWAYPNRPCGIFVHGEELHIARYERANKKGVVSDEELARARAAVSDGYVIWEEGNDGTDAA